MAMEAMAPSKVLTALARASFEDLDSDGDGVITREEFEAFVAKVKAADGPGPAEVPEAADSAEASLKEAPRIQEGLAEVLSNGVRKDGKTEVFYNPAQVFNRDMSVVVLSAFAKLREEEALQKEQRRVQRIEERAQKRIENFEKQKEEAERKGDAEAAEAKAPKVPVLEPLPVQGLKILEALAATGIRTVRYAKELPAGRGGVASVVANDLDPSAVEHMKRNFAHNELDEDRFKAAQGCANAHMYARRAKGPGGVGNQAAYDVIDLDPYGTVSPFVDAAVQAIADGGLLCITSTDMPVLGGNHPETCFARYGGAALKAGYVHEMALRLVLHVFATAAARYGREVRPLLCCSIDFYVRLFIRVFDSPARAKRHASKTAVVHQCVQCESFFVQRFGEIEEGKEPPFATSSSFSGGVTPRRFPPAGVGVKSRFLWPCAGSLAKTIQDPLLSFGLHTSVNQLIVDVTEKQKESFRQRYEREAAQLRSKYQGLEPEFSDDDMNASLPEQDRKRGWQYPLTKTQQKKEFGCIPAEQQRFLWRLQDGHLDIVEDYLGNPKMRKSVDLNRYDAEGLTPLHHAAKLGRGDIVKALIAGNADPLLRDKVHGCTALDYAKSHGEAAEAVKEVKYKPAKVAVPGTECSECKGRLKVGGPFHCGPLYDADFLQRCLRACSPEQMPNLPGVTSWKKINGLLTAMSEEHPAACGCCTDRKSGAFVRFAPEEDQMKTSQKLHVLRTSISDSRSVSQDLPRLFLSEQRCSKRMSTLRVRCLEAHARPSAGLLFAPEHHLGIRAQASRAQSGISEDILWGKGGL
ncbi:unnamed protein product [Effrenium voratum]|nr:unnamed protein product [Effrenium voratum]